MSLKQEIETWVAALAAYDNHEFDNSLRCFETIADTSKILFNLGVVNATLGEHAKAVEFYQRAVALDQYLAIAYFQQGVSNFLMGDFEEALANFNDTLLYLRGNNNIDYEQLGLKFKLFSCEVLFNRGLCYIYLQQKDAGMQDLIFASREKMVPDHDVINEAIKEQAEGYTVFSIPVGVVYRPNEAKVKNLQTKDYLGKARLVAAQERSSGDQRRQAALAALAVDDRPDEKLSYAALNLVKPDLRSRSRQQSEPPMHRNVFPPTPPPECERADSFRSKRRSDDNAAATIAAEKLQSQRRRQSPTLRQMVRPLRLELGAAAFDQRSASEQHRRVPKRSESERPTRSYGHPNSSPHGQLSRRQNERRSYRDVPEVIVQDDPIEAYSMESTQFKSTVPSQHQRIRSTAHAGARTQPITISEEEPADAEVARDIPSYPSSLSSSDGNDPSLSSEPPLAFEIIPPRRRSRHHPQQRSHSRHPLPPEVRVLRIKVHGEDMRYVMTTPAVRFAELFEQIRAKFSLQAKAFKLKIKDEEGDSITMADQEDLDMAIAMCRATAAKERVEIGKMEVWIQEI